MKRKSKRTVLWGPGRPAPESAADGLSITVQRQSLPSAPITGTDRAATKKDAARSQQLGTAGFRDLAAGVLLLLVTVIAYMPALNGGLLWDDDQYVTKPALQSFHGLWRIWFDLGTTGQYYPLLYSAFWVEHRLWGDAVLGYHLINVLLHVAAACLLVLIAKRLSLPGAWLAGYVFVLHPVCVETVAWISEQKTTLSAVFYLAAAFTYLHFDRTRRRSHYFLALALFVLALLSKTVAATLPAALLVVLWWQRKRLSWKGDALPLLPWFALGATAGLVTSWMERRYVHAEGTGFALTLGGRCLLAGRVIWFYLSKVLWPVNLMFTYPRWKVDPAAGWQYLFPVGALGLAAGLWLLARWGRRGALAGFLFFAGTLFPALGFFNVFPFIYSYVADHFQYLATLGILVPLACGLAIARERIPAARRLVPAVAGVLLATLFVLTWRQSGMYRNAETLYRETLRRNPASWMAHNNLGVILADRPGRLPEAIAEFEASLRLQPDNRQAENNLGNALLTTPGRMPEGIPHLQAALALNPNFPETHYNLALALSLTGRIPEAIAEYKAALQLRPNYPAARNNLGRLLSKNAGSGANSTNSKDPSR
jgi:tetratricopeptide (TPR) repeat protein